MEFENRTELLRHLAHLESGEGLRFFSLEDCRRLLDALGQPQNAFRSIHIVGTNGKGSVGAMLSSMFSAAGASVGHTPSPHLFDRSERCLLNGRPLDGERYLERMREVLIRSREKDLRPGFFVVTFAASMLEFAGRSVDWGIIEAGLGGIDDATNVLDASRAAVITSIGYDHVKVLGSSLEEIAAKKAGIAKAGVPMFVGEVPEEAVRTIARTAAAAGAPLEISGKEFSWNANERRLFTPDESYPLDLDWLALAGSFQRKNAVLAARTAFALGLDPAAIQRGLETVSWPGRYELFHLPGSVSGEKVLFDIAHNEQGTRILAAELARLTPPPASLVFIVSILDRKDHRGALRNLVGLERRFPECRFTWICTTSGHPHARAPEELAGCLDEERAQNVVVTARPEEAFHEAAGLSASTASNGSARNSLVVVTGSTYLVSKLRPLVSTHPFETIAGAGESRD